MPYYFNRAIFFTKHSALTTPIFKKIFINVILIFCIFTVLLLLLPLPRHSHAATALTTTTNKAPSSTSPCVSAAADHCNEIIMRKEYALDAIQLTHALADALGTSASAFVHSEHTNSTPFALPADLAIAFARVSTRVEYTEIFTTLAQYYINNTSCALTQHSCHSAFLAINGKQLLRRPLTPQETQHWQQQFSINSLIALSAFLSQKEIRYIDYTKQPNLVNVATRMSLMLNDSTPDTQLLNKALNGSLAYYAVRIQEAERLIHNRHNFYRAIRRFYSQWLGLYDNSDTSLELYTIAFAQTSQLFKPHFKGTFHDLLINPHTLSLPSITSHEATILKHINRPGLFAKTGFLRANNNASIRGWKMRDALLCDVYYSPSGSHLNDNYQHIHTRYQQARKKAGFELPRSLSIEYYLSTARARGNTACNACHEQYLPLGRVLNIFNTEGDLQTHFTLADGSTQAIHTDGRLDITTKRSIAFDDAAHLLSQIARTPQAQQCFVSQWLSFAAQLENASQINHAIKDHNTQAIYHRFSDNFSDNKGDLKQLLIDIASSHWLAQ